MTMAAVTTLLLIVSCRASAGSCSGASCPNPLKSEVTGDLNLLQTDAEEGFDDDAGASGLEESPAVQLLQVGMSLGDSAKDTKKDKELQSTSGVHAIKNNIENAKGKAMQEHLSEASEASKDRWGPRRRRTEYDYSIGIDRKVFHGKTYKIPVTHQMKENVKKFDKYNLKKRMDYMHYRRRSRRRCGRRRFPTTLCITGVLPKW